jgi:ferredoxin/flavodoxin
MDVKQVKLIYFSPTGTTQKILESIAKGITTETVEHINLTPPDSAQRTIPPFSDELVILGAPVYGGRLPVDAVKRFKRLHARNTLAILVVVYGNREFDDALLELKHLAGELGFVPVAGGAFIGEHSFATQNIPIASGRPDNKDEQTAIDFGTRVKDKITALTSADTLTDLALPGNFPSEYNAFTIPVSPVTNEDECAECGTCVDICPTAAISMNGSMTTDIELCISCCACIKNCSTGARVWEDDKIRQITNWLYENCSTRKEPQVFGVDS